MNPHNFTFTAPSINVVLRPETRQLLYEALGGPSALIGYQVGNRHALLVNAGKLRAAAQMLADVKKYIRTNSL